MKYLLVGAWENFNAGLGWKNRQMLNSGRVDSVSHCSIFLINAALAQLVEHLICNQEVIGSIPIGGSNKNKELRVYLLIVTPFFMFSPILHQIPHSGIVQYPWQRTGTIVAE